MDDELAEIRERFDARAADYDRDEMHRQLAQQAAQFVEVDGAPAVLDVATGTGLVLRALAPRLAAEARLIGIDVSPGMLAVARRELPSGEWLEGDAAELPLPDASIDLVTCVTGLQIIPRADAAIAEWARVLRPAGRAVTATFARRPASGHGGASQHGSHERWFTPQLLDAAFAPTGLAVARHREWIYAAGTEHELPMLIAELRRA